MLEEWVTALRSGEYQQGKGWLFNDGDDGITLHCCLGVLRELHPDIPEEGNQRLDDNWFREHFSWTDDVPSDEKWCDDLQDNLIEMNDGDQDFEKIADYLEQWAVEKLDV